MYNVQTHQAKVSYINYVTIFGPSSQNTHLSLLKIFQGGFAQGMMPEAWASKCLQI